jgi:Tol biopolymer transport system component
MNDRFGIYTVELSGKYHRTVTTSDWQQLSHPRISPDREWVTFTRYNNKGKDGTARENGIDYTNTEICTCRVDGTQVAIAVPAKPGIMSANSSWASVITLRLLWASSDNEMRLPVILAADLTSGRIDYLPTRGAAVDPHVVGQQLVYVEPGKPNTVRTMTLNGWQDRQVTSPKRTFWELLSGVAMHGDYDPKLSPDGKKVAFMRLKGANDWRVYVIDLASGRETQIAAPGINPDWSSDGKRIIYSHYTGLSTIRPDGSDRKVLLLPVDRIYNHPAFFPTDGSGQNARIIYQAVKEST